MATAAEPRAKSDPGAPRFVFENVSWQDYEAMLRIVGERHVRVTYDRGRMEILSPSLEHESDAYLLRRIVDTLTEEWGIPIEGADTTTLQRTDLAQGAEADKCYCPPPGVGRRRCTRRARAGIRASARGAGRPHRA